MLRSILPVAALSSLLLAACADSPTSESPNEVTGAHVTPPTAQWTYGTPLQAKIGRWATAQAARGLPVPAVSFEFSSGQGSSLTELEGTSYAPGKGYEYRARTVMHYDGPAQAGLERWPEFTVSEEMARTLGVDGAELMHRYVDAMEAARPGFWSRHQLGFEPRTYTISESGTGLASDLTPLARTAPADATVTAVTSDQLVLGFSLGLDLARDRSWSFGLEDIEEVTFTVHLRAGFGLRLPLAAALDAPDPMDEGSTYSASSTVEGVNWSAGQYSAAGVAAQDGKEAYAYLQAQACVSLSGVYDRDEDCAGPNRNESTDFATPFGPGASFPLPTFSYTVVDFGVAGVDLNVTPTAGSDKITAQWTVAGEALGGGGLEYSSPASPIALSPVLAVDGPGNAHYSLNQFRYYFNSFALTFGASLWVHVPIPLAPDWDESWGRDIVTFDLSDLIGALDLSVGTHAGSSPTWALGVPDCSCSRSMARPQTLVTW